MVQQEDDGEEGSDEEDYWNMKIKVKPKQSATEGEGEVLLRMQEEEEFKIVLKKLYDEV